MDLTGSTALITGANRGLGRHFAQQLLDRGAAKVYATARRPKLVDLPGVHVLQLDITDPASVAAAAALATDVTLVVNNAGISTGTDLVASDIAQVRLEMETNFFGPLNVVRAFAPMLAANGGGAVLNVLSAASWISFVGVNAYTAAKAAAWSLTNGVRLELAPQGTQVTGLYFGMTDTDMTAGWDVPKNDPADVVRAALDGLEAGQPEVLADAEARQAKAALAGEPGVDYAHTLAAEQDA